MFNINSVNFVKNNYVIKNNTLPKLTLKQLTKDTVSFTGQRELTDVRSIVRENANCEELAENAKVAEKNLKKLLTDELSELIYSDTNPEGIVDLIKTRIKDPNSIEEKVTSIIADGVRNDPSKVFQIKDQNSIKWHINDIVGARIILKQPDPQKNSPIIQSLIQAIRDGKIKIKKVDVIVHSDNEEVKPYFTDDIIDELKYTVGNGKYSKRESETGYSAIHIDVDLSDDELQAKHSGYSGEIQIMGPDVAYFKDLEDHCYKVKQSKNIKAGHPAYAPFVQHLNKYLLDKDGKTDAEHKKLFDEYTYRAYIIQRKKDKNSPGYNYEHLPSIEECGMTGEIPNDLDFNYLQKIKKYCDDLYDLSTKANLNESAVKTMLNCNRIINSLGNMNLKSRNSIMKIMDKLYQLTTYKKKKTEQ